MATKTSNIFARVEPSVKIQAESILTELGLPMSNAIALFLKKIIIHNGIPFEMKLAPKTPASIDTTLELAQKIKESIDDINNKRVYSLEDVEAELNKVYELQN